MWNSILPIISSLLINCKSVSHLAVKRKKKKKTAAFWLIQRRVLTRYWEPFFYFCNWYKIDILQHLCFYFIINFLRIYCRFDHMKAMTINRINSLSFFPTLSNLYFIVNSRQIVATVRELLEKKRKRENGTYILHTRNASTCVQFFFFVCPIFFLSLSLLFSCDNFVVIVALPLLRSF
jgi:hypothetical protein